METTESTDVVKLLEEVDFEKAAVHMKARAIFMPNLLKHKGNTHTSGLVSGLVTIRSGNCGAKFKKVDNLKAILISSLYQYPEANLYQSAMHPDGFQFTIPNPDLKSVSIS